MSQERAATIEQLLDAAFSPSELLVKDQSHLNAGHAGAQEGKGHFEVRIVSDRFAGQSRIARHRIVGRRGRKTGGLIPEQQRLRGDLVALGTLPGVPPSARSQGILGNARSHRERSRGHPQTKR